MNAAAASASGVQRSAMLWALRQMLSKRYRGRLYAPIVFLLLATVAETIGIGAIWPVLMIATDSAPVGRGGFAAGMQKVFAVIGGPPSIEVLLLVVFLSIVAKAAVSLAGQQAMARGAADLAADFRRDLMSAFLGARWDFIVLQSTGAFANAIGTDATRAAGILPATVNFLTAVIAAIPFALIALSVSWQMTIGALLIGIVIILMLRGTLDQTRRYTGQLIVFSRTLIARLVDAVTSLKPIKAMDLQDRLWPFLAADVRELAAAESRQGFSKNFQMVIQEPLITLIICLGLYFALRHLQLGIVEIGFMVVLYQRLLTRFVSIQSQLVAMATCEVAYLGFAEQVAAAVAAAELPEGARASNLAGDVRLRHGIDIQNVSLSYPGRPLFTNLDVKLPAGGLILITGPSGAGKTSLIDLITGLQWPQSGSISVDGIALDAHNVTAWRQRIGYVPQELQLLNGSVFDNVCLMNEDISRDDVRQALGMAGAWEFVAGLPQGMDSAVGERGASLSGGQRQRIAIARALVRKPDLLILDEATTALDPKTEQAICETLSLLVGSITVVAISHQPALVSHATLLLRIDEGKLSVSCPEQAAAVAATR